MTAMDEQKGIAAKYRGFLARLTRTRWTDDEIADALGVTRANACLARQKLGLPPVVRGRDLARFRRFCQERFENGFERLNGHEPKDPRTPLDVLVAREEASRAMERLASAGRRAGDVAALRAEGLSLAEIGRRLGVSRERARQIWTSARSRAL